MQWSRIKNIIILILALANAFLLTLVITREVRSARYESEALTSAVHILEQNGIAVDRASLPENMNLVPCEAERDRAAERALAAALLGEVTEEERGGDVFRYVSTAGTGSIQFHSSGAFLASFAAGSFPLEQGQSAREHAEALLARLQLTGETLSVLADGDAQTVVIRQTWQNTPVYSCAIRFHYEGGELRSITESQRLVGTPVPQTAEETISVSTALIRFLNEVNELGDVCSEISRMEAGYVVSASLSGPARLSPVWRFETEIGAYQIDAVTGAFSKEERS